jgi:two-component system, OmpR family, sensor kinase
VPNGSPELISETNNLLGYGQPLDTNALHHENALIQADGIGAVPAEGMLSETYFAGEQWRVLSRPLEMVGESLVIQAATSMSTVNQASRGLFGLITIEMALALIGTVAIGFGMTNRALNRIDVITRAADKIAQEENLKVRLPHSGPMDEIGRLTRVFNGMMDRIQHMFTVQERFVADVSHELRTPLTAIRGNLDLIKRYGMDQDSMDAIESEVDRMSRLVSDLLMLAKADSGTLTMHTTTLEIDDLITDVYRQGKALIAAKHRDIKLKIGEFEGVKVNADADRMRQLLLNLISNAIKFTPDGGTITINLRKMATDAVIEVADTGIGIAPEDQKRVFDRFFQSDESRVRGDELGRGEGVGLGLSIAKWIVEAHGGKISCVSELGKGTTFMVSIPHLEPVIIRHDAITRPRLSLIRRDKTGERQVISQEQD